MGTTTHFGFPASNQSLNVVRVPFVDLRVECSEKERPAVTNTDVEIAAISLSHLLGVYVTYFSRATTVHRGFFLHRSFMC